MAKQLLLRRGTSAENNAFTGEAGEITFDNTNNRLRVHNGTKEGGYEIPRSNEVVHLSGNETIEGTKTFSANPIVPTPTSDTHAVTKKYVDDRIVPVGLIAPYGGTSAPTGWLMCNGQAVSRTTYATLFNKIGTAYGAGDGSTTFNLPNYTNVIFPSSTTATIQGTGTDIHIHTTTGGNANKDAKMVYNNSEILQLLAYDGWHDQPGTDTVYFGDLSNDNVGLKVTLSKSTTVATNWIIKY